MRPHPSVPQATLRHLKARGWRFLRTFRGTIYGVLEDYKTGASVHTPELPTLGDVVSHILGVPKAA